MVMYYTNQSKSVEDFYTKRAKHFRDTLISRAFAELKDWSKEEVANYVVSHGYTSKNESEDLKNAKILIIKQYDEMDYQTLLKMYNYGKLYRVIE